METTQVILIVISFLVGITCFSLTYKYLADALVVSSIKIGEENENDDEVAIQQSISLAKEAKKEIEIFDDGDLSESYESLYHDDRFIHVIEKKLENNPKFRIRAFFNDGDPRLKFIQAFKDNKQQVEIYKRKPGTARPSGVHYRLIDGGIKGVFTKHGQGDGDRIYRELNILNRSKRDIARAGRIVLRKYRQPKKQFERLGAA